MKVLRIAAAVVAAALLCAACVPEPPAPAAPVVVPPAPPAPPPPTLPVAPIGASTGPVDPADSPDPFILRVDPAYCTPPPTTTTSTTTDPAPTTTSTTAFSTSPEPLAEAAPDACYLAYTTQWYLVMLPLWRSTDLVTWTRVSELPNNGSAMIELAPWAEWGWHWAPSVIERPANPVEARFVMWYTARDRASGLQCLGVATASTPIGPFVDTATKPAYCRLSDNGTIDADPFVDSDGTVYLTYAGGTPGRLRISRLTPDAQSIVVGTETVLLTGGAPDADVVEGPTLVRADGVLYLFYSTGAWWTTGYRVGVARCDSVAGPCNRMYGTGVLATRGTMAGPGGQTPFVDAAGEWKMIFHSWTAPRIDYPNGGARSMHILPLSFAGGQVTVG